METSMSAQFLPADDTRTKDCQHGQEYMSMFL